MQLTEIKTKLAHIIEAQLGWEGHGRIPDDAEDLLALGVDSLALLEVVYDVELAFGVSLGEEDLTEARTVGGLVDLIARKHTDGRAV
jgi:acyl carrier protein